MKQMCETMKVNEADPVDALILDRLHQLKEEDLKKSRNDFALSLRNTLREEDEDYKVVMGLRARELAECYWELMKTPSPMLRVNVELDKIDLEIEKSQYENIACFLDDFLASLPPSQPGSYSCCGEGGREGKRGRRDQRTRNASLCIWSRFICLLCS